MRNLGPIFEFLRQQEWRRKTNLQDISELEQVIESSDLINTNSLEF